MSFLSPLALALGGAAAAAVVALHLLTTRRPPPLRLPTARFIPVNEARAVARASRPTDLMLLALRALAVLLVGAAFARPVFDAPGPAVRTVVALDVSSGVADREAAFARAREAVGAGGALVVFDDEAREWTHDTLPTAAAVRGRLSPALVVARVAATRIARGADSVRLVLMSPVSEGAVDAATAALRGTWPGRIDLVRLAPAVDSARAPQPALVTTVVDDPLGPALALLPEARGAHEVRIVRGTPHAADSAWVRASGRVLIVWPHDDRAAHAPDGVTTVGPGPAALVAPLARLAPPPTDDAMVLARWRDAEPAATERRTGAGCIRQVAVGLPVAGDLTLRPGFVRFLDALVVPCGGRRGESLPDERIAWLTEPGPLARARGLVAVDASTGGPIAAWLLVGALALLLGEWTLRGRPAPSVARGADGA